MYSEKAINKYPVPKREMYFTDADYTAALIRVDRKREEYDKQHKSSAAKGSKIAKTSIKLGIIPVKRKDLSNSKCVIINNVEYSSISIASKALNIRTEMITDRINSPKFPSWRFKGVPKSIKVSNIDDDEEDF